jgi:hypothetical protein
MPILTLTCFFLHPPACLLQISTAIIETSIKFDIWEFHWKVSKHFCFGSNMTVIKNITKIHFCQHFMCSQNRQLAEYVPERKLFWIQDVDIKEKKNSCPIHLSYKLSVFRDNVIKRMLCCLRAVRERTYQNCYIKRKFP